MKRIALSLKAGLPVAVFLALANTALAEKPEGVNADPHGNWLMEIRLSNPADLDGLLDQPAYVELVK